MAKKERVTKAGERAERERNKSLDAGTVDASTRKGEECGNQERAAESGPGMSTPPTPTVAQTGDRGQTTSTVPVHPAKECPECCRIAAMQSEHIACQVCNGQVAQPAEKHSPCWAADGSFRCSREYGHSGSHHDVDRGHAWQAEKCPEPLPEKCGRCDGAGSYGEVGLQVRCARCHGTGKAPIIDAEFPEVDQVVCSICGMRIEDAAVGVYAHCVECEAEMIGERIAALERRGRPFRHWQQATGTADPDATGGGAERLVRSSAPSDYERGWADARRVLDPTIAELHRELDAGAASQQKKVEAYESFVEWIVAKFENDPIGCLVIHQRVEQLRRGRGEEK